MSQRRGRITIPLGTHTPCLATETHTRVHTLSPETHRECARLRGTQPDGLAAGSSFPGAGCVTGARRCSEHRRRLEGPAAAAQDAGGAASTCGQGGGGLRGAAGAGSAETGAWSPLRWSPRDSCKLPGGLCPPTSPPSSGVPLRNGFRLVPE